MFLCIRCPCLLHNCFCLMASICHVSMCLELASLINDNLVLEYQITHLIMSIKTDFANYRLRLHTCTYAHVGSYIYMYILVLEAQLIKSIFSSYSYQTLIGVHEVHGRMHPNYGLATTV